MAVSHFLKPLYLYNRICDFKQSLKKAVVNYESLKPEDNVPWNSSSFCFQPGSGYTSEKRPCQTCRDMFEQLPGFLGERDNLREEGVDKNILAQCGEYVPTNRCLPDNAESNDEEVNVALINFREKCTSYMKDFHKNLSKCVSAHKSTEHENRRAEILRNVYDTRVKDGIHIFGVKPECNGNLRGNR